MTPLYIGVSLGCLGSQGTEVHFLRSLISGGARLWRALKVSSSTQYCSTEYCSTVFDPRQNWMLMENVADVGRSFGKGEEPGIIWSISLLFFCKHR